MAMVFVCLHLRTGYIYHLKNRKDHPSHLAIFKFVNPPDTFFLARSWTC